MTTQHAKSNAAVVAVTPAHIADYLYRVERLGCNCDLDNWEPERSTGHSCVCRIHKVASARHQDMRPGLLDDVRTSLIAKEPT